MRIVITGPESSGKTALTVALSYIYKGIMIPELSREYLNYLDRKYTLIDVEWMAENQFEQSKVYPLSSLVFEDGDLLNYIIWEEIKYEITNVSLMDKLLRHKADLYLYCEPDLPWIYDPLRENPLDRPIIGKKYLYELNKLQLNFQIINGIGIKRYTKAIFFIEQFLRMTNFVR